MSQNMKKAAAGATAAAPDQNIYKEEPVMYQSSISPSTDTIRPQNEAQRKAKLTTQVIAGRIDAECRHQGVSTAMLARVMGVSPYRARAIRTGRYGRVTIADVFMAARALEISAPGLFREVEA